MRTDAMTQARNFLWQNDAEFGNQAAQPVIGRGALFDEALPRAVQAQDDLLVFFFDGDKAHRGPGDGLGDGGGVSGGVPQGQASRFLPRLPPIRYGVTNFGAISSTVWPCRRNSRAQWCAPEQASTHSRTAEVFRYHMTLEDLKSLHMGAVPTAIFLSQR